MPRKKDLIPKVEEEVKVKKEKKVKDVKEDNRVDMILSRLKELKTKKEPEVLYESESDDDEVEFIIEQKKKQKIPEPIPEDDDDDYDDEPEPIKPVKQVKPKKENKPKKEKEYRPRPVKPMYDYNMINTLQQENDRLKAQMKYNGLSKLQNQSTFMKIKF
jgi:hypothetical protein